MSHGHSFKTDFQKRIQHVLMITQMKACIIQMGIPVSCAEPSGLLKETIYSVLLGQPREKSAFISQYSSYESLVFLNILKYSHVHMWYWRLIHLSLDAFLITGIEKQNRRKWKRLLWKEKPHFLQS